MAHVRKQMITFFMTTRCNLRCIYCYTPKLFNIKPEHQVLDFAFAKRGIDDFFRDNASRHIRFYGIGEPTLEFELMKKIHKYALAKAGKSLVVELQTNGTFSEKIARWVNDNVNVLWISCDGPPIIQNKQRPTKTGGETADIVEKRLKYFAKNPKIQAGARVTLTSFMIAKQNEIVDYFHKLGVRFVNVLPTFAPAEGSDRGMFSWKPLEFAQEFLKAHKKAASLGMWYNTMCIVNFDEKTRYACRACTPCPHLTTDGYVSCCDFAQLGPKYSHGPLQQLIYGRYDAKRDLILYNEKSTAKIKSRCVENLMKKTCAGCKHVYNCAGGCVGQVVNETGDLMGKCEQNCIIVNYLANHLALNDKLHPAFHS